MGLCFGCFGGGSNRMTKEEERLASEEARARAAEAAQKRFLTFIPFFKFPSSFFKSGIFLFYYHVNHSISAKEKKG